VGRLVRLAALAAAALAGLATAYVVAGTAAGSGLASNGVTLCHATSSEKNPFDEITVDASSILGHHGHGAHSGDIIPPIEVIDNGVTESYPGMNIDTIYEGGYTGAEVLANGCEIPIGTTTETTGTVTTVTTTVSTTVTVPGTTVILPPETTTAVSTITVTVPATTVTAPGSTTIVTVPSGATTTVTLPVQTITLPPSTVTVGGEEIIRPPVTTTLPATTTTIIAGTTTTTVTLTGPNKIVQDGVLADKKVVDVITTPARTVRLHARIIRALGRHLLTERKTVIIIFVRGCPPGTAAYQGRCSPIVRGSG